MRRNDCRVECAEGCAQWYDGCISLPGCDKNMPGCIMAMGRLNRPGIMVYGGTIKPGFTHFREGEQQGEQKRDIVSAFQCYGEFLAGRISEEERKEIVPQFIANALKAYENPEDKKNNEPPDKKRG